MELPMAHFDEISRTTPFLVNVRPSGKYLMEDFFYAGGVPAVMKEIESLLHTDALTITGKSVAGNLRGAVCHNRDVIRRFDQPLKSSGGTVVLYGNLCPDGAVLKQSAASERLMQHTGRAVVFEDHDDLKDRLDDPNLDVDENCVLVLKNGGPKGGPGMPEWGNLPIPTKLYRRGIHDMVRISDARMSGTSYGTVVLHIAPEAALGGPLAIVRNGDLIQLDVANRQLNLLVPESQIQERKSRWQAPVCHYDRGYGKMFLDHILQANEGCDFDFLRWVPRPEHLVGSERSKLRRATDKMPSPF
jgi:dihydroxyacid dehydratase/phosphogluconate dehydratase